MPSPQFRILAYEPSPLGILCLRQRRLLSDGQTVVTEISLDGEHLMSDLNCESEKALAAEALSRQPGRELRVLVGGLGLGVTARAILESPRVASLQVVEFLPQVIDWFESGLLPLSAELKGDPRFAVIEGDVYGLLESEPDRGWDLILIDVDHSPDEPLGPQSARFYSAEGLSRAAAHLEPGGILGVWSYAPSAVFESRLRQTFGQVWTLPVNYRDRSSDEERTDWILLGSGTRA